jgi:AraC-like DNA-binding protein
MVPRPAAGMMSTASPPLSSQSYRERSPEPKLAELVSCVWIQQVSRQGPAHQHRTVPNGCAELACDLEHGCPRIAGPKRGPVLERLRPGATVVGVRFRPGVAPMILGSPASELVDLDLELDQLWGRSADALGARLAEAVSPDEAASMLEHEVGARCAGAPDSLVVEAVKRLQPWRHADVSQATSELFISPRHFRRRFAVALGYGPKSLQRILRFQGFLALSHAYDRGRSTIADLAATAGYADQAHLTRECSRLTGLTPSVFLDELRHSCGPTHDHGASFAALRRALLSASPAGGRVRAAASL